MPSARDGRSGPRERPRASPNRRGNPENAFASCPGKSLGNSWRIVTTFRPARSNPISGSAAGPNPGTRSGEPEKREAGMRSRGGSGWTGARVLGIWGFACATLIAQPSGSSGPGPWGPETPRFNLEIVLRGDGFGLVRFRQPNDDVRVVDLDVWVRDLAPNTSYLLQRA